LRSRFRGLREELEMSANGDDERILRTYLLGGLAPESRKAVEDQLCSDDRIFLERLSLMEDELIDDYVADDLDREEEAALKRNFVWTLGREERLNCARALKALADSEEANERLELDLLPAPQPFWHRLFAPLPAPAWAVAVAAMLLLVLPSVVWQLAPPGDGNEVSEVLTPSQIRGIDQRPTEGLKRVRLPPDATLVKLQMDLAIDEYSRYRAELYLAAGDEILIQSNLEAESVETARAVTLVLPADLLPPGDYFVRLSGVSASGEVEPLDRYDFRVLRE